jgi:branched-chain amino acid transport system substrate-binding protein
MMRVKTAFKWFGISCLVFGFCLVTFSPAPAEEKKEILIGATLSLTGPFAQAGRDEAKWAYEEAVKDINKAGGVFVKEYGKKLPVRLIIEDDESDPAAVVRGVEKLIKDHKVDLLLSTCNSPLVIPGAVTAEKYKKYYHATTCLFLLWRPLKLKYSTLWFFMTDEATEVPFIILLGIPESKRPKRLALLMEDSMDGQGWGWGIRKSAKKYGIPVAFDEPWAIGAKDYSGLIMKLKKNKIDSLLLFGNPVDCITLIRQLKEMGMRKDMYIHINKGGYRMEFWKALGKDAQGVLVDGTWSEFLPYPGALELGERYYKQWGYRSAMVGIYYALCQSLWAGIEKAGSLDSMKVRKAMSTVDIMSVMGPMKYNEEGMAVHPPTGFQWWDGVQQMIFPFFEDGWKVKLPPY